MTTNFGATAEDYAKFRAGFPDSLFERLAALGIGASGETIVDVGTGTGTLARGFALRGCKVIGIDPDDRLLTQARRLDGAASVAIDYKVGYAETIPLADGVADVVTERLIMKHNPNWRFGGMNGIDFSSLPHLHAAGFSGFETVSYDMDVAYSPEAWRGRIRASAGVGASLAPNEVEAFDAEHARLLEAEFSGAVLQIPHRVFAIIGTNATRSLPRQP